MMGVQAKGNNKMAKYSCETSQVQVHITGKWKNSCPYSAITFHWLTVASFSRLLGIGRKVRREAKDIKGIQRRTQGIYSMRGAR